MDRMMIRITIVTLILAGIGGYAFFEFGKLRHGPIITIDAPLNGSLSNSPVAEVKGVAKNIVRISMNDRDISVNESGEFLQTVGLSDGNNTIKVSAEDRFGRRVESFVEILYTKPNQPLVKNTSGSEYQ